MTYDNAYEILCEVRRGINEYSAAYAQGTDTSGAYDNTDIIKKINQAQKWLYDLLVNRDPQLFYKSTPLTPSNNILTMPGDFYAIRRLEDSDGLRLFRENLDEKKISASDGSHFHYYWKGGQIVLDSEYTDPVTLYYKARPREIHSGISSAGGALSLTLVAPAHMVADYYNNMIIENVTDNWVDTISDYSAAGVAALAAQTGAASKVYGIVSELPEALYSFIGRRAILTMRATYKSLMKPTAVDFKLFNDELSEALGSLFGKGNSDQVIREIFE